MTIHSPACQHAIDTLLTAPVESVEHRIGERFSLLTDTEIRDDIVTFLVKDPADSVPVRVGLTVWSAMAQEVAR